MSIIVVLFLYGWLESLDFEDCKPFKHFMNHLKLADDLHETYYSCKGLKVPSNSTEAIMMDVPLPPQLRPLLADKLADEMSPTGEISDRHLAELFVHHFQEYRRKGLQPLNQWDRAQALAAYLVGFVPHINAIIKKDLDNPKKGKPHICSETCTKWESKFYFILKRLASKV